MTATTQVESGAKTFTSRQAPWLRLGPEIEGDVDSSEAARLGGIDFNVTLCDAGFKHPDDTEWTNVPTRRAVIPELTERTVTDIQAGTLDAFFGFVSDEYSPVQYAEAFAFMDAINPRYVSAGRLKRGRQGFMVVQLPESYDLGSLELGGEVDPHELYVVLRTSHDLSRGIEVALVTLRERCMNMLTTPSLTRHAPQRWAIRHVGDPHVKLDQAKQVLTNAGAYVDSFKRNAKRLIDVPVTVDDATVLLEHVLPDRPRRDEQISAISAAFRSSEYVGFAGTGWGLVNAVSEYFEWHRTGRTDESYFTCGLEGPSHKFVGRVAQLLLR
jgi:phage/plasmid-like protein (TIGR03299 family)